MCPPRACRPGPGSTMTAAPEAGAGVFACPAGRACPAAKRTLECYRAQVGRRPVAQKRRLRPKDAGRISQKTPRGALRSGLKISRSGRVLASRSPCLAKGGETGQAPCESGGTNSHGLSKGLFSLTAIPLRGPPRGRAIRRGGRSTLPPFGRVGRSANINALI